MAVLRSSTAIWLCYGAAPLYGCITEQRRYMAVLRISAAKWYRTAVFTISSKESWFEGTIISYNYFSMDMLQWLIWASKHCPLPYPSNAYAIAFTCVFPWPTESLHLGYAQKTKFTPSYTTFYWKQKDNNYLYLYDFWVLFAFHAHFRNLCPFTRASVPSVSTFLCPNAPFAAW